MVGGYRLHTPHRGAGWRLGARRALSVVFVARNTFIFSVGAGRRLRARALSLSRAGGRRVLYAADLDSDVYLAADHAWSSGRAGLVLGNASLPDPHHARDLCLRSLDRKSV